MARSSVKDMTTNFMKLEKFEGNDFRRWRKKMHFMLTMLKVVFVLTKPMPELVDDENAPVEAIRIRAKWENDDYICRGYILNGMSDSLFDVYTNVINLNPSTWQRILLLPPSWKDFKHTLKHGKDDLSLVQLGSHLRIEESLRGKTMTRARCGKTGHFKRDCHSGNKKNASASGAGKGSKDHSQVQLLYMGDAHFAPIHGKGSVVLEFSLGKTITLFNVLYVPKLRKNLISGPVLNKCGYKQNKVPDDSDSIYMSSSSTVVNSSLWHARLGHVHYKRMLEMCKDDLIPIIDENHDKCTTCMLTKITYITRKFVILELIHSDLCDFHATPSLGNKKYVITFIDNASRFCYVYLLHTKDEALDKFRIYKTEVELQQNDLVKTLRTDRGGEYYDPVYFQSAGITHETTAPYTPQQNGVAERKNRALKEIVNSMLSYSGLSEGFWGEAMLTACYLLNMVSNKRNKTTPYELWYKKRPNLSFLRHSKAYRFYVIEPNDSVSINLIIESRDAIFDENHFSSISRPKDIIPNLEESQRDDHSDDVPSEIPEPRKGKRVRKAKSYGYDFQLYLVEGSRDQKEAIDDEIGSIMENGIWILSDLPPGCKPLGCKWIFKRKMEIDGTIDKFKARLVIQGFRQKEGIDYFDTYAPVARITTIRLLLALAVIHNLVIHQMDVKTTFLNGDLDEEVYMKQPEGFVMPGNEHKVFLNERYGRSDIILGIKIKHENKGIIITQSHYIEKILKKFNREDFSPVSTPMDPVEKLKPNTGRPMDQLEYSRAIGCLMYAMTSTRPDITYDVGRLKGYTDASWINHVEDSSYTSGWVVLLGGGAICWASKKQTCITGSAMEYEFVALAVAGKEA
ncbi:zinc finger, CCHC-type containing protein [Tanacetum coccineum]